MIKYPFPPYPHQERAVAAILEEWDKGQETYIHVATGGGKTETAFFTLAVAPDVKRVLFLAHRNELITQPLSRLQKDWIPTFGVPGVVKAGLNECKRKFTIASVPTIKNPDRLAQLLAHGPITHVVVDECHHVQAKSYQRILEALRAGNPDLKHLGLTATPHRTDKDPLSKTYNSRAFSYPIGRAIKDGALCPFVAYSVKMEGVSIKDVAENEDGWDGEQLGEVMSFANAEKLILETWEKHTLNKPTILFCPSVAFAHSVAQKFREAGHKFVAIDGTTATDERAAGMNGLKNGKVMGIANFGVCTEGFDAPNVECVMVARPVKSDLLYVQMIGRGLRTHPGKEFCTILDFMPVDGRDMVMAGDVTGKPRKQRNAENSAREDGIIGVWGIDSKGEGIDGDPDKIILALLDYFQTSRLEWYFQSGWSIASVDSGKSLAIRMPDPICEARLEKANLYRASGGEWLAEYERAYQVVLAGSQYHIWYCETEKGKPDILTSLGQCASWERASQAADGWVAEHGLNALSDKKMSWRKKEATIGQMRIIKKYDLEALLVESHGEITRGLASKVISWVFTNQALKRHGIA